MGSSSLTHGTDVGFAGGAARGLRRFKSEEDGGGWGEHAMAVAPSSEPRIGGRGPGADERHVEYEVAGDRTEFAAAIESLRSWRMARSKGGWCPEGAGGNIDTVLRIKEGGVAGREAWTKAGNVSRPSTAPTTSKHSARPSPSVLAASTPSPPTPKPQDMSRSFLDTPSTSSAGGLTPRPLSSLGAGPVAPAAAAFSPPGTPGAGKALGKANGMSDSDLISMLRRRPKSVPEMRTRGSFRKFFRGMEEGRLRGLLRMAYEDLGEGDREAKVDKRIALMREEWAGG